MSDDKPNPEEYKVHMRTVHASEDAAMRHNDFVGAYNNTGRVKLDQKKWTPTKPEEGDTAFRADDWMGSGKPQRKSWKVKSSSNVVRADEGSKPGEFVRSTSETRRWQPPPKDEAISPPWMASPPASSPHKEWKPKSPSPKPVNASSDHSKEQSETNPPDLHSSMNHMSLSSPEDKNEKEWQSHGALNHTPHVDHSTRDHEDIEEESKEIAPVKAEKDDSSDDEENYEVASEDEAEVPTDKSELNDIPPATELAAAPPAAPVVADAAPHHYDDDDRPNPEEYKVHMRTVHASEDAAMRHGDFVGSYNNTGRVKLDQKKWTPTKPEEGDNAFRADDWMGSGKPQRKSWKVKK